MPEISRFYGIVIWLWPDDHAPPHFHARYAGQDVAVDIRTARVTKGRMPRRALRMVLEWTTIHRVELLTAWDAVRRGEKPGRIAPLE